MYTFQNIMYGPKMVKVNLLYIYIVLHSKLFRCMEFTNSLYPDQLNEQVVSVYKMAN